MEEAWLDAVRWAAELGGACLAHDELVLWDGSGRGGGKGGRGASPFIMDFRGTLETRRVARHGPGQEKLCRQAHGCLGKEQAAWLTWLCPQEATPADREATQRLARPFFFSRRCHRMVWRGPLSRHTKWMTETSVTTTSPLSQKHEFLSVGGVLQQDCRTSKSPLVRQSTALRWSGHETVLLETRGGEAGVGHLYRRQTAPYSLFRGDQEPRDDSRFSGEWTAVQ